MTVTAIHCQWLWLWLCHSHLQRIRWASSSLNSTRKPIVFAVRRPATDATSLQRMWMRRPYFVAQAVHCNWQWLFRHPEIVGDTPFDSNCVTRNFCNRFCENVCCKRNIFFAADPMANRSVRPNWSYATKFQRVLCPWEICALNRSVHHGTWAMHMHVIYDRLTFWDEIEFNPKSKPKEKWKLIDLFTVCVVHWAFTFTWHSQTSFDSCQNTEFSSLPIRWLKTRMRCIWNVGKLDFVSSDIRFGIQFWILFCWINVENGFAMPSNILCLWFLCKQTDSNRFVCIERIHFCHPLRTVRQLMANSFRGFIPLTDKFMSHNVRCVIVWQRKLFKFSRFKTHFLNDGSRRFGERYHQSRTKQRLREIGRNYHKMWNKSGKFGVLHNRRHQFIRFHSISVGENGRRMCGPSWYDSFLELSTLRFQVQCRCNGK